MYVFVLHVYAQDFYCNAPLVYGSYSKRGTTKLMIMIMIMIMTPHVQPFKLTKSC